MVHLLYIQGEERWPLYRNSQLGAEILINLPFFKFVFLTIGGAEVRALDQEDWPESPNLLRVDSEEEDTPLSPSLRRRNSSEEEGTPQSPSLPRRNSSEEDPRSPSLLAEWYSQVHTVPVPIWM
jgi:hypothetical protein